MIWSAVVLVLVPAAESGMSCAWPDSRSIGMARMVSWVSVLRCPSHGPSVVTGLDGLAAFGEDLVPADQRDVPLGGLSGQQRVDGGRVAVPEPVIVGLLFPGGDGCLATSGIRQERRPAPSSHHSRACVHHAPLCGCTLTGSAGMPRSMKEGRYRTAPGSMTSSRSTRSARSRSTAAASMRART